MTEEQARAFAHRWIAAWNSHDVGTILDFYRYDIEYRSPFVRGLDDGPVGVLRGTSMLAEYFTSAIERFPALTFDLFDIVVRDGTVTLIYRSISNLLAVEKMSIDDDGRIWQAAASYQPLPAGSTGPGMAGVGGPGSARRSGGWPALSVIARTRALTQ